MGLLQPPDGAESSAPRGCHEHGQEDRCASLENDLDERGAAVIHGLLSPESCDALAGMFGNEEMFRSTIVMQHHGFGRGTYRYFDYPLPEIVAELRRKLYPLLARIAAGPGLSGRATPIPSAWNNF